MNTYAASIGMRDSEFTDPGGVDDGSVVSARDLLRATERLLDSWLLAKIVATPWTAIDVGGPNPRELIIENTNQFVLFDGAFGIKTGTTEAAGQCLVNGFHYGDHKIITVVLGSQDRYADTIAILNAIDQEIRWVHLGGEASSLGAREELEAMGLWMPAGRTVVLSAAQTELLSYRVILDDDPAPGRAQGQVQFLVGPDEVALLPVYALP